MNILNNSFSGRWVLNARRRVDKLRALIAQLFGNGEQGAMYIPKPQVLGQQVLWQDVEGTVPVMSDGDPVGLMLDLSGNDNHATQETSAARPIYRTDGTLHWLQGNGVNQHIITAPVPSIATDALGMSIVMAARRTGTEALRVAQYGIDNQARVWNTRINTTTPNNYSWGVQLNTTFSNNQPARPFVPHNTRHTMSGRWQGAGSRNEARVNLGEWVFGQDALPSSGEIISQPIEIFSDDTGTRTVGGDFFGMAVRQGYLIDDLHNQAEEYFASLAGVTL